MSNDKEIIQRCCQCKCIKDLSGNYNPLMVITNEMGAVLKNYDISDGYCEPCYKIAKAEQEAYNREVKNG